MNCLGFIFPPSLLECRLRFHKPVSVIVSQRTIIPVKISQTVEPIVWEPKESTLIGELKQNI